jgi:hypothetical protein
VVLSLPPVIFYEFLSISVTRAIMPELFIEAFGPYVYFVLGAVETVKGKVAPAFLIRSCRPSALRLKAPPKSSCRDSRFCHLSPRGESVRQAWEKSVPAVHSDWHDGPRLPFSLHARHASLRRGPSAERRMGESEWRCVSESL